MKDRSPGALEHGVESSDLIRPPYFTGGITDVLVSGDARSSCWTPKAARESGSMAPPSALAGSQQGPPLKAPGQPLLRTGQNPPKTGRGRENHLLQGPGTLTVSKHTSD